MNAKISLQIEIHDDDMQIQYYTWNMNIIYHVVPGELIGITTILDSVDLLFLFFCPHVLH